jgi:hypothetical protein
LNIFCQQKKGVPYFLKSLTEFFLKQMTRPPSVATKKFQLPQKTMTKKIVVPTTFAIENSSTTTKRTIKFLQSPILVAIKNIFSIPQGWRSKWDKVWQSKKIITILPSLFFEWRSNYFYRHKRKVVIFSGKLLSKVIERF